MFKPIPILAALLFALLFTANAQTDSTHFDLGRILVKKDFTQSITIKGSDLERYQSSDLSDAINVWLYGTYTNSSSVIYVVDGNIINDVNSYSVYDIDEITLVQNALPQVSGAGPGQQMVLIKLRNGGPGKQGVQVAGQTSIATQRNQNGTPGEKSTTNLYNQYYLSGYRNFQNAHFSASADYQHDVFPALIDNNSTSYTPFNFDRFKLNALGDVRVWKGSTLTFGITYAPQVSHYANVYNSPVLFGSENSVNTSTNNSHVSQHLFNSTMALNSQLVKGLNNSISVAYNHYNYFERDSAFFNSGPANGGNYSEYGLSHLFDKTSKLLIRDNLVYHAKLGALNIEPSLNFSYRNVHDTLSNTTLIIQATPGNGSNVNSLQQFTTSGKYRLYLITPSLNVYYKDILNIQSGFVDMANARKDFLSIYPLHRVFPFLTASVDIGKLAKFGNFSLQIFGSFAKQNALLNDEYPSLAGFGLGGISSITNPSLFFNNGTVPNLSNYYNYAREFNNYSFGALLGLSPNFTINYVFTLSYNVGLYGVVIPFSENSQNFEEFPYNNKTTTNRIGFNYNYSSGKFNWRTGLNFTEAKLQVIDNTQLASQYNSGYLSDGYRWSGGFTNRFSYNRFFAGIDFLYRFGERPLDLMFEIPVLPGYVAPAHVNSISLQNLYAGTQLKITKVKYAEAFINCRNILQNNSSDITDNRKFVGLGFKVGL